MSLFTFTKTELHNLFSKPATQLYPQKPKVYPERTRGHVENDIEACIFCGLCSRKCPTGAIAVDRKEKSWAINRFSCIQCRSCVDSCPKKCLSMKQTYTQPASEKKTMVYHPAPKAEPAKEAPEKTPEIPDGGNQKGAPKAQSENSAVSAS